MQSSDMQVPDTGRPRAARLSARRLPRALTAVGLAVAVSAVAGPAAGTAASAAALTPSGSRPNPSGVLSQSIIGWGDNSLGELGNALALTTDGRILAWGRNSSGQLGNGTTNKSTIPVRVRLPPGFKPTGIGAGWSAHTALAIGNAPLS